ncbi:histidinol-phosphatase (PHP family) [Lachnospiraceae bacterium NE2001]|nr:histidinol-phosphatase (PHP family) [Lachnospiraceae bacterium NE2001]
MSSTYTIPDYHLHSEFSADCDTNINEIISRARATGMNSLCFTDHNDLDFPDTPDNIKFDLEIDDYIETLSKLRNQLSETENADSFDVRIGVEQGVMPTTCERLNSYTKEHPGLDFVICSSHVVDGFDPYYPEFWVYPDGTVKNVDSLYRLYFEEMLYNVQHFQDYNVYGHIDYIFRYGPDPNAPGAEDFQKITASIFEEKYWSRYKDIINEILRTIIDNGKGIEINSGSLYRGMDYMHPHSLILAMFKEMGGEILTIGSDAHDLKHIGYDFDAAAELAKSYGFKYYCTFKNMKPEYIFL